MKKDLNEWEVIRYQVRTTEVPAKYQVRTKYHRSTTVVPGTTAGTPIHTTAATFSTIIRQYVWEVCYNMRGRVFIMKKWLLALVTALVLAACGDKDTNGDTAKTNEEIIEEGTVGFEVLGGSIEEVSGVPAEEKEKLIAAFNEYIEAFNEEDIDRYAQTTSKQAKGFDYKLDLQEAQKVFDQYEINRQAENITIVKYNEEEAQVFANLKIEMTEEETNTQVSSQGRQVTVFVSEDGTWKVSSVYYIGDN